VTFLLQVGTVSANDPDLGPNGSVSFYLEALESDISDSDVFHIDPATGVITVQAGKLDRLLFYLIDLQLPIHVFVYLFTYLGYSITYF